MAKKRITLFSGFPQYWVYKPLSTGAWLSPEYGSVYQPQVVKLQRSWERTDHSFEKIPQHEIDRNPNWWNIHSKMTNGYKWKVSIQTVKVGASYISIIFCCFNIRNDKSLTAACSRPAAGFWSLSTIRRCHPQLRMWFFIDQIWQIFTCCGQNEVSNDDITNKSDSDPTKCWYSLELNWSNTNGAVGIPPKWMDQYNTYPNLT